MLLERDGELDGLLEIVSRAAAGEGQIALITGPAGIGKTALLQALRERAGIEALAASGSELEREFAFGVILQLLERRVSRLAPGVRAEVLDGAAALAKPLLERASVPADSQFPLLHGLYWVLSNLSERGPLLLTVDDVQWADAPSLAFLEYLAPRLQDVPIAVFVALRAGETPPRLVDRLPALELRPLSQVAVAQLVRERFAEASDDFCRACLNASRGNPFLVRELLASVDGPDAELDALTPDMVRRWVAGRLARLPVACVAVARAVAVLGPDAGLANVAALSGASHEGVVEARELLAQHELLAAGDDARFVHPLVRSSVYGSIPVGERRRLHRRAAERLAATGAGEERVARQLLAGEHRGDAWAVDMLCVAADVSLAAGDPVTSASYLERALAEPPPDASRVAILTALGRAETFAGQPGSIEHLREAGRLAASGPERARVLLQLGRAHLLRGESLEAAGAFDAGLAQEAADVADELQAAWLFTAQLHATLMADVPERIRPYLADPPAGTTHGERVLLGHIASHLAFAGADRERAQDFAARAFAHGRLVAEATPDELAWIDVLATFMYADDLDAYDAGVELVLRDAQRRGSITAYAAASYSRGLERYFRGRLADAIANLQVNLEAGREGFHFNVLAHARLCWCELERDDPAAAQAALAPMVDHAYWSRTLLYAYILEARARLRLAQRSPEDALADALAAVAIAEGAFESLNPGVLALYSTAALAADAAGDHGRARALIAVELERTRRWGAPRAIGIALRAAGLIERRVELLEQAVDVLSSSPSRLEYARALVDYGAALRRDGQRRAAADALRTALDLAHRFGAVAIARQAREELVASGARPRRAALRGVDALTPSERRTAELAVAGMSNREIAQSLFVTLRTVEAHLSNAYAKLGIQGRGELAQGLDAPA